MNQTPDLLDLYDGEQPISQATVDWLERTLLEDQVDPAYAAELQKDDGTVEAGCRRAIQALGLLD